MSDFRSVATRWLAAEPDADMREELESLLAGGDDQLALRFDGRLQFGTAGLRAAVGAGPQRMNRLVVQQAAAGLVDYLLKAEADAATRGVIIGYDARRKSDAFALDTARVCAARGVRAMIFPHVVPTPLLAWNIVGVGAAAGVVVTASHNPPADNGYKVFTAQGAQIVSPVDAEIAECIDLVDPCTVPLSEPDDPLIAWLDDSFVQAYLAAVPAVRLRPELAGVPVAYSAMHGVGGETLMAAFDRAGLLTPFVVAEQQQPDPTFPTVSFPNPEEPGAMDLLLAKAAECGAAIALCNDPDADRLGAAIPTPDGGWRRLLGDEIGWLLGDHILRHTTGDDRLVITTLVSSSLLSKMAAEYGVRFAETYTGFKWIGHTVLGHPESHFVFGYEQALGYLVCGRPLDKDGITAAVLLAEVAALAKAEGVTLQSRLDAFSERFGRHVMADMSVKMPPVDGTAAVARLRADPPTVVDDRQVSEVKWFDEAGLLRLQLGPDLRLQLRPSGTEPKVKLYGEGIGIDPAPYLQSLATLL
ncbi:MAG: phospho-sugar mutase [Ilumatobacteraceae bacterium]|nr:phospho-sugar mutase [Ilumatobacteraceae bacterium]